jgi:hypothetical protein
LNLLITPLPLLHELGSKKFGFEDGETVGPMLSLLGVD